MVFGKQIQIQIQMATNNICKNLHRAAQESLKGTTKSPTGAILRNGSQTLMGSSNWERQTFAGKVFCMSGHGEMCTMLSTTRARKLLPTLLSYYGLPPRPDGDHSADCHGAHHHQDALVGLDVEPQLVGHREAKGKGQAQFVSAWVQACHEVSAAA